MTPARARRLLDAMGHAEVLPRWPGEEGGHDAPLGPFARRAFAVAHRRELEAIALGLPRSREARVLRGRALWLLERDAEAAPLLRGAPEDPASLLAAASAALERRGRWSLALRLLDRRDALTGGATPSSAIVRGLALLEAGRWAEAAEVGARVVAARPELSAGWLILYYAERASGRLDAPAYHEARDREPDCGGALNSLPAARALRLARYDRALRARPGSAVLRAERAEVLREPGVDRHDLALAEYRALEARLGHRAWFQAFAARAEGAAHGLAASLRRLDRACRLFPDGGWLFAWRGETLRRLRRRREALRDFDRAVRLQPWYGYSYAWRGAARAEAGRWTAARADLDAALALGVTEPTRSLALHWRSLARERAGDWAGALSDRTEAYLATPKYDWEPSPARFTALARLLRSRPGDAWGWAWLGRLRFAAGRAAAAEAALDRAIRLAPGFARARQWRGEVRLARGRTAAGEADLRRALAADPACWRAALLLAEALSRRGRPAAALAALDACAPSKPCEARYFLRRAAVLLELGRPTKARVEAEKALALDPLYDDALVARAVARGRLGDKRGSLADFRRVYRSRPEAFAAVPPEVMEALE